MSRNETMLFWEKRGRRDSRCGAPAAFKLGYNGQYSYKYAWLLDEDVLENSAGMFYMYGYEGWM